MDWIKESPAVSHRLPLPHHSIPTRNFQFLSHRNLRRHSGRGAPWPTAQQGCSAKTSPFSALISLSYFTESWFCGCEGGGCLEPGSPWSQGRLPRSHWPCRRVQMSRLGSWCALLPRGWIISGIKTLPRKRLVVRTTESRRTRPVTIIISLGVALPLTPMTQQNPIIVRLISLHPLIGTELTKLRMRMGMRRDATPSIDSLPPSTVRINSGGKGKLTLIGLEFKKKGHDVKFLNFH